MSNSVKSEAHSDSRAFLNHSLQLIMFPLQSCYRKLHSQRCYSSEISMDSPGATHLAVDSSPVLGERLGVHC